ncbi:MAG: SDR family NAD(P)-dependent oxidoreductase [Spirochaetia bacterium]|nr:SDR family NAD(P)-dependent oxidoreductase [Spirochaetia bacterium]
MNKYLKQYEWSNVGAMIKNDKKDPLICNDSFLNKLVVISGTTSGIGYYTAKAYASHGANLLIINRNEEKTKIQCEELSKNYNVKCDYIITDYTHLSQVIELGEKLNNLKEDIDVLIHNAGVYMTTRTFTDDGLEKVFQVNYLSSFILNYMLKDKLAAQEKARIIFVNSEGHRFAIAGLRLNDLDWKKHHYSGLKGYGSAKTAQLLSMITFTKFYEGTNVSINAMHPGNVSTNMGENNGKLYRFFKHRIVSPSSRSPEVSAQALYYLGVSKELDNVNGRFFNLTTEEIPAPHALDEEMAWKLWDKSIELGRV